MKARRAGWDAARAALGILAVQILIPLSVLGFELGSRPLMHAQAVLLDGVELTPKAEWGLPPAHPASLNDALGSLAFVTGVGGVAFGGVASPAGSWRVIGLNYVPGLADGRRLQVVCVGAGNRTGTVTAAVHDWALVPIARFADSPAIACFTLFGRLARSEEEKAHRAAGREIMNYHSTFADTLLGLRLMQADLLILDSESCDLPREGGRVLAGGGEDSVDVQANVNRLVQLQRFIGTLTGGPFQSYVICDYQQEVRFSVREGSQTLELTGNPYWYCWKMKVTDPARRDLVVKSANEEGNRFLRSQMAADRQTLSDEAFQARYNDAAAQARFNAHVDRQLSRALLEPMHDYSRRLSEKIRYLDGINPVVYQSLVATMRFAAFFRHVRQTCPEEYQRFMATLREIRPVPAVQTPTVIGPAPRRPPAAVR